MQWVLLFQEFDLKIKDKKRLQNTVVDHLSRLPEKVIPRESRIIDEYPDEQLVSVVLGKDNVTWFVDIVNYKVVEFRPLDNNHYHRQNNLDEVWNYFWDKPYLFRICADSIIRKCVTE